MSVNEFEKEISKEQYDKLEAINSGISIIKDRYVIPYIENRKIELDVFHGKYEGIIFAEIEFESEEQGNNIKIPELFGIEIGNQISNDMMAKNYIDIKNY